MKNQQVPPEKLVSSVITEEISNHLYLIGVGASAGGLEALQDFLAKFPADITNIAIIIAQHLSPTYKSMLVELLARNSEMPVIETKTGTSLKARHVYITPPDSEVTLKDNKLILTKPKQSVGPKPSIDVLFHSMAKELKEKAIGVILSGTGSDGAQGIKDIKQAGGMTIAQDPQTAKYDGMPHAAIQTGVVDLVLAPEKIGDEIRNALLHPEVNFTQPEKFSNENNPLQKIFTILSDNTGTNFSNYKEPTIYRRLEKRMTSLKYDSLDSYVEYLQHNPKEVDSLYHTILIGVTSFNRDPLAFNALEAELTKLLNDKQPGDKIRIWVPGCASGEEPYTIGILISEILKKELKSYQIQIFSTDLNENAILYGRKGIYPAGALKNLSEHLVKKYFIKRKDHYEVNDTIRQMVLFSRHDLTVNPPFLKLDLISCRNLLIYFGMKLQEYVMPLFHYALNPNAYLFLGKSETIGQYSDLFSVINPKYKIYQRKRGNNHKIIHFGSLKTSLDTQPAKLSLETRSEMSLSEKIKLTIYNTFDYPYIVINDSMSIIEISGDVSNYLIFPAGSFDTNIFKLIVKDFQLDLRMLLNAVLKERSTVRSSFRKIKGLPEQPFVRLCCKPLLYSEAGSESYIIIFEHLEQDANLPNEKVGSPDTTDNPMIKELQEELAITKEHLQTYIEELETANEELQSLNEELQSSNEELQSVNEELETTNEELQSSSEEVQVAYGELKLLNESLTESERKLRITEMNAWVLLNNTLQIFILIDKNYLVIAFNDTAAEYIKKFYGKTLLEQHVIMEYFEPIQEADFYQQFGECLGGKALTIDQTMKIYNGDPHYFKQTFTPVYSDDETVEIVSIGILEITKEKNALDELVWAKDKAEESNRLKANFLANMSHELRTPMVGLIGYAEVLRDRYADSEAGDFALTIYQSAQRLLNTLNLILDLSRAESGKEELHPKVINAVPFIKRIAYKYVEMAKKQQIRLSFYCAEGEILLETDERILEVILDNLISNAIKFTSEGYVEVRVETDISSPEHTALISVIDTGIGIAEEHQEMVFDAFRQASEGYSRTFEGTGLGLAVSRQYARLMGSELMLKSTQGKGSIFSLSLPISDKKPAVLADSLPKSIEQMQTINILSRIKNHPRFLLVDDDALTNVLLSSLLGSNIQLDFAPNVHTAEQMLSANDYHIIFLDINLKDTKTGLDIVQMLQDQPKFQIIPIVALTAYAMLGDKERFLNAGFTHYLSKPFTKIDVQILLEEIYNKYYLNELDVTS